MVKIQFYPISVDYRLTDEKMYVQLYGRTDDGRQVCVQDGRFEPYFYVLPARGIEEAAERIHGIQLVRKDRPIRIIRTEIVERRHMGKKARLIKVCTQFPQDIPELSREISSKFPDLKVFEDDISITRRYIIDKNLIPLTLAEADGDFINQRSKVSVFDASSVEHFSTDQIQKLNTLAIDIEVYNPAGKDLNPDHDPILMIGFYSSTYQKVIVTKQFPTELKYVEFAATEAELLHRFEDIIAEQKPDVIVGYNSDALDFPYLLARAEKYGIRLDLGLDYSLLKADTRNEAKSAITGICHVDISQFIRKTMASNLETQSLDLNSVSKELIGQSKIDAPIEKLYDIYDNHPEELGKFCEYNLQDALLSYELYTALFPNLAELARLIGLTIFDISRMAYSQLVEWYLIKRAIDTEELIPNRPERGEIESRKIGTFQGAFVYPPEPGLYKDIVVFDFRSLYPSIITTHNISTDTLNCDCCEGKNIAPGEKDWFCKNKKGFIASVIEELISRRQRVNDMIKRGDKSKVLEARQYVLKTLANSMYGYLGFFMARWYSIEAVRSITSYGRYYVTSLIEKASKEGYSVLYGDTDSVFLSLNGKTHDEAKKFVEIFNMDLPEQMELDVQGFYKSGIFVSVKSGQYAAKKRYALLTQNNQLVIKGFETVRRNTSKIARDTQRAVLKSVLKDENTAHALELVKSVVASLKNHEIPLKKLIISTELQKTVSDYESIGPHVAVAKRMIEKGQEAGPGTVIRYIICGPGERVRDKARLPEECGKDDYDSDYYINNQVVPAVEKIFEVLGISRDDLLSSLDQSKLNRFFG
jgi:DNA polymerase, archaea type